MMGSNLDELTRALYARKKPKVNNGRVFVDGTNLNFQGPENALLKCPKCPNRLRPLLLQVYEEDGETYQKIWWTCRGLKTKKCIFPLMMPPNVFWTRRTEEQMRQDVIPLPNFNLLPKEYWKMYPTLFKNKKHQLPKPTPIDEDLQVDDVQVISNENSKKSATISSSGGRAQKPVSAAIESNSNADEAENGKDKEAEAGEAVDLDNSFEALKERESSRVKMTRKSRSKQPTDDEGRSPIRKKMTGVTIQQQSNKTVNLTAEKQYRKSTDGLKPAEERIIAGGRNFDFKMVDEITSQATGKINFHDDGHSTLKTALVMRFAKKEFMDRITGIMSQTTPQFQRDGVPNREKREMLKIVEDEVMNSASVKNSDSDSANSECEEKFNVEDLNIAKKTVDSYWERQRVSRLSSRLGIKLEEMDPSTPKRPKMSMSQIPRNDSMSRILDTGSTTTNPTNSTPSFDSNSDVRPVTPSTNFQSPELNSLVQRHLQTLKTKSEKQKKKRRSKRRSEISLAKQQQQNSFIDKTMYGFGNEQNEELFYDDTQAVDPVAASDFHDEFNFDDYDIFNGEPDFFNFNG